MRTVAIVGSRDYPDLSLVERLVDALPRGVRVVTGGARGVDRVAETAARRRGIPVSVVRARWESYGRAAGPIRNRTVVEAADLVVAFWDGQSRGTANVLALCERLGKPALVVLPSEEVLLL